MKEECEQFPLLTRRKFVCTSLVGSLVSVFHESPKEVEDLHLSSEADPRLKARPHKPFRPFSYKESWLGAELEKGALMYIPETYSVGDPSPLAIFLHSGGGSATDWSRIYSECEKHRMILLAPESRGRTWDAIEGEFGPDVRFLDSLLRYLFDRCSIDTDRIGLFGFSDGATYSLSLGPSNGDLFTHLVAFSPGGSQLVEPVVGSPKILVVHGKDDRVLPVSISSNIVVPTFQIDGYDISYCEFEGGHEIQQDILEESLNWFMES